MMLIILASILPELIAISAIASESIAALPLSIAKVEIASEFYAMLIILSEILLSLA